MKILLVDDDKNIRQTLELSLKTAKHAVTTVVSAEQAIQLLKNEIFDFVLTDFKLDGKSGIEIVKAARLAKNPPYTVVMTAFASFENAVIAIKEGAYDYIPKPFSMAQLSHIVRRVENLISLKNENEALKKNAFFSNFFSGQTSPAAQRLEEYIRKAAPTPSPVLLVGESGTGKSEVAKLIHLGSTRSSQPFVVINCAMPGAMEQLRLAQLGTALIEDISDLSNEGQLELLRVLQEPKELDVRVIAATRKNLEELATEGKFREDLLYRLNSLECQLVPLRHRKEDLPIFLQEILKAQNRPEVPDLVLKRLQEYSWPGNFREFKNTIERLLLLSGGREMKIDDLPDSIRMGSLKRSHQTQEPLRSLEEVEKEQIQRVLLIESNQERAAEILGITSVTLWRKRKQYGLP